MAQVWLSFSSLKSPFSKKFRYFLLDISLMATVIRCLALLFKLESVRGFISHFNKQLPR